MTDRDPTLGRRCGVFVPAEEFQAYELNGWVLLDDLADMTNRDGVVLMAPRTTEQKAAA